MFAFSRTYSCKRYELFLFSHYHIWLPVTLLHYGRGQGDFLDYCEGYILLALSTNYWETMYARTTSSLHFERRHEQLAYGITGCGVLKEKLSRINLTSNMWDPV